MGSYHPAKFAKIWIFLLFTLKNSNFCKFCWVMKTQPISVLKLFLLYWFIKGWLVMCSPTSTICDVHSNLFWLKLVMCDIFLGLQSAIASLHIFSNSARNNDRNCLSFGANYVSVAQKLRILEFYQFLTKKNPWMADSIDDRRKINAEILSFKMR